MPGLPEPGPQVESLRQNGVFSAMATRGALGPLPKLWWLPRAPRAASFALGCHVAQPFLSQLLLLKARAIRAASRWDSRGVSQRS